MRADVAVVGGGPAGASAAHFLARAGCRVVLLEQKTFPRDKPCGDGLTPRALDVLQEMGLAPQMRNWRRVAGVRMMAAGTTRTTPVPLTHRWCDYGVVVRRRVLDRVVLEHAEATGALVRYAATALHPLVDDHGVHGIVASAGGRRFTVHAPWLVCAEGAAGRIRRGLGRRPDPHHPLGLALRQYCGQGAERLDWFDVHLDLREPGGLLPGYGWAFPTGDGMVNVGVGLLHTAGHGSGVSLRGHLDRFVERLRELGVVDPRGGVADRRGGRLFMGGSVEPPHGPGFVLIGDAAGMINPSTGEGIAYALETGRLAARHVVAALGGGERNLASYGRELQDTYGPYYRLGRALAAFISHPARMERLVRLSLATDRRLRFAATLLLNLDDPSMRNLDQIGARGLVRIARLPGFGPPPARDVAPALGPAIHAG